MLILIAILASLPPPAQELADRSERERDADKAIELLEEAVNLAPRSGELHGKLGRRVCERIPSASIFRKPSLASRCREELQTAVDLAPDDVESRQMLFMYYLNAPSMFGGGADKAKEELARIERIDAFQGQIARANWALHDKKDAVPALEAALAAARSDGDRARALRGLALQQLEKPQLAIDAAEKAKELDPGKPAAFYTLGRVYVNASRTAEARAAFERFLRMEDAGPRADDARKRLAELPRQ